MAPVYRQFATMPAEELVKDAQAMAIGERLFLNNCAQCHGADARQQGLPNLTDGDWPGAGAEMTRTPSPPGRQGMMPPMAAAVGSPAEDVKNVANYVL